MNHVQTCIHKPDTKNKSVNEASFGYSDDNINH